MSEPAQPPTGPATELTIEVARRDGVGTLSWATTTSSQALARALSAVGDEAILGTELRRLEVSLPASDAMARRAVQGAGFRLEGVRRLALRTGPDSFEDVVLYARLASDVVPGPEGLTGVLNTVLPRTRVIAHVLFRDGTGRVLCCRTSVKTDWELPGGVVEVGESPRRAAVRETGEELGVKLDVGGLLAVDWLPPTLGWDDAVELVFDGGVLEPQVVDRLRPDGHEVTELHWAEPSVALAHLRPGAAARMRLLLAGPGPVGYLEDGRRG